MDKQKRSLIILGAVFLVGAAVWIRGLTVPVRPRSGAASSQIPVAMFLRSTPVVPSSSQHHVAGERGRTRFSDWDRSPFLLHGELAQGVRGLLLDGIVWDAQNPLAMINNQVLAVGDSVGRSRITRITKTEVFLEEEGSEFILRLGDDRVPDAP